MKKSEEDKKARKLLRVATIGGLTLNHRQRVILADALTDPDRTYTVSSHQAAHTITYPTALNDLNALVASGLIKRQRIGKAFEFFAAPDMAKKLGVQAG